MPTIKDENMSLESYAHDYLENAVDKVEEITGSRNVTLFGYCWGGILSLIYSALHPENVKNLILHATPVNFGKSPTILESWIKDLDVKRFVDFWKCTIVFSQYCIHTTKSIGSCLEVSVLL